MNKKTVRRVGGIFVLFVLARAVLQGSGGEHSILNTFALMGLLYGMYLGFRLLMLIYQHEND
jgi:uncharacterized membrane protein